jgi:hypothetical protein
VDYTRDVGRVDQRDAGAARAQPEVEVLAEEVHPLVEWAELEQDGARRRETRPGQPAHRGRARGAPRLDANP